MKRHVVVPDSLDGERADKVVAVLGHMSRSAAKEMIDAGEVLVDGDVAIGKLRLAEGQVVQFEPPEPEEVLKPDPTVAFEIRFVDADVIVVDKPAGLTVHPGAGRSTGTLAHGLVAMFPEIVGVGEPSRWGIVHRLDKDTSGLLVVARTQRSYDRLIRMMAHRQVRRGYVALVEGLFDAPRGTIDAPVSADPNRPTRRIVSPLGRPARTHYRRRQDWERWSVSLVDIELETGRTHQIRVHFASIGHPVVGDRWYGKPGRVQAPRVFLHAARLGFDHPVSGEPIEILSPLPADLQAVIDRLGDA